MLRKEKRKKKKNTDTVSPMSGYGLPRVDLVKRIPYCAAAARTSNSEVRNNTDAKISYLPTHFHCVNEYVLLLS